MVKWETAKWETEKWEDTAWCMCVVMQIADSSILPSILEFNVTVEAVSTPAYDVVLSTGSSVFTITSTDSIRGPSLVNNSSNFTITDNSLMTWKQTLLSKSLVFNNLYNQVL